ncbi:MAG: response regulator, partial [Euryhalocaulis sp.]|uniref:response regulator n=1 Tax=Euryhalocaulis sp. TaxID=2744307 RepID=UPI00183AEFFC
LEAMLSSNVRSIEFAEDGQKALEAMERRDFDVILMDKQMPNMDGMAATRAIREMKGSARDIYIIAVTADAFDEARDQILACGMDDFIAKPVAMETLLSSLRKGVELGLSHAAASAEKPDEIREAS